MRDVKCSKCQLALRDRVACAMIEWASVKVSFMLHIGTYSLVECAYQRTV